MDLKSVFSFGIKDKLYVWLIALMLFELIWLVYSAMVVSGGFDKSTDHDSRSALTAILDSITSSDDPAQTAADVATYQMVCEQESYSAAISGIRPAVVYLEVQFPETETIVQSVAGEIVFDTAVSDTGRRIGSGVIIDSRGYILTNHHVVADTTLIEVTPFSSTRQKYRATIIRDNPQEDLAVIKIDTGYVLPEVTIGNSSIVEVGDIAIAIGSPFGMEHTATLGIISDDSRSIVIDGHQYVGLLQTDAAINRGNSGGALVNCNGEVIGINTAIFAPTGVFTGIGLAIPIDRAKVMLAELGLFQSQAEGL